MLFGVSARKTFAAFALGADAAAVPPSFLFRLPFFSERKAGKRKPIAGRIFLSASALPTCCTKRTVPIRTARFFVQCKLCEGEAPCSPSPAVPFVFSSEKRNRPLNKQRRTRCSECGALRCVSCFICRCCGKRPHSRSRWRCLSTIPPAAPARRSPAAMRARFRAERSVPYHRERRPPAPRPRGRR